ncbi:hypothetical protein AB0D08_24200 [Kitasatospora sp. NPDC048540]|uniref:hypothetical protein n=1 Tax=Kitasatospora sp. NPDC048540 TaxID=3155634 RepID=UPI0033F16FCC
MRVQITRVLEATPGLVEFRCELGRAVGAWMGSTAARHGEFDVEIEVQEEISTWTVLDAPSPGSIVGGAGDASQISITGTVVDIGEADDPVVGIRLGPDVLLIEAPDRKWEVSRGTGVLLNVHAVQLYPIDL